MNNNNMNNSIGNNSKKTEKHRLLSFDHSLLLLHHYINGNNDIISTILLNNTITHQRMTLPYRSLKCLHLQCFDMQQYLYINKRNNSHHFDYYCPICKMKCNTSKLYIDSIMLCLLEILNNNTTYNDIDSVTIDQDMNFIIKQSKKNQNSSNKKRSVIEIYDSDEEQHHNTSYRVINEDNETDNESSKISVSDLRDTYNGIISRRSNISYEIIQLNDLARVNVADIVQALNDGINSDLINNLSLNNLRKESLRRLCPLRIRTVAELNNKFQEIESIGHKKSELMLAECKEYMTKMLTSYITPILCQQNNITSTEERNMDIDTGEEAPGNRTTSLPNVLEPSSNSSIANVATNATGTKTSNTEDNPIDSSTTCEDVPMDSNDINSTAASNDIDMTVPERQPGRNEESNSVEVTSLLLRSDDKPAKSKWYHDASKKDYISNGGVNIESKSKVNIRNRIWHSEQQLRENSEGGFNQLNSLECELHQETSNKHRSVQKPPQPPMTSSEQEADQQEKSTSHQPQRQSYSPTHDQSQPSNEHTSQYTHVVPQQSQSLLNEGQSLSKSRSNSSTKERPLENLTDFSYQQDMNLAIIRSQSPSNAVQSDKSQQQDYRNGKETSDQKHSEVLSEAKSYSVSANPAPVLIENRSMPAVKPVQASNPLPLPMPPQKMVRSLSSVCQPPLPLQLQSHPLPQQPPLPIQPQLLQHPPPPQEQPLLLQLPLSMQPAVPNQPTISQLLSIAEQPLLVEQSTTQEQNQSIIYEKSSLPVQSSSLLNKQHQYTTKQSQAPISQQITKTASWHQSIGEENFRSKQNSSHVFTNKRVRYNDPKPHQQNTILDRSYMNRPHQDRNRSNKDPRLYRNHYYNSNSYNRIRNDKDNGESKGNSTNQSIAQVVARDFVTD